MVRFFRTSLASLTIALSGCVVAPPPTPVITAPATAPVATSSAPQTQHCREFQKTVTIGGRSQEAYGTSCLQPDGSWKIVSPEETSPSPAPPPVAAVPVFPAYRPVPFAYYPGYVFGPPVAVGLGFGFGRRW